MSRDKASIYALFLYEYAYDAPMNFLDAEGLQPGGIVDRMHTKVVIAGLCAKCYGAAEAATAAQLQGHMFRACRY